MMAALGSQARAQPVPPPHHVRLDGPATSARGAASAKGLPFNNRRAWGSRESNVAQASKVAADSLAGLLNDPNVTTPVLGRVELPVLAHPSKCAIAEKAALQPHQGLASKSIGLPDRVGHSID